MTVVKETARAKVNLTLEVLGRRVDGYHELQSLVGFTEFGDELKLEPSEGFRVEISGPFSDDLTEGLTGVNLVEEVGQALMADLGLTDFGTVYLDKKIPIAAGLGGGSADAAALIRLVMKVTGTAFGSDELAAFGKRFGADIPVCVGSNPSYMSGIGEVVETISPFPNAGILLVNPGVSVGTGAVFKALGAGDLSADFRGAENLGSTGFNNLSAVIDFMRSVPNDLLPSALSVEPVIGEVMKAIEALPHCQIARLSGSGATCFGMFETSADAVLAGEAIAEQFPHWWQVASTLRSAIDC